MPLLTVGVNFVVDWFLHKTSGLARMSTEKKRVKGEVLLEIKGLKIEGSSDGVWHPIVKGVDLTLQPRRGAGPDR